MREFGAKWLKAREDLGTTIQVKIGGEDEVEAMQTLGDLIRDGFGEE